MSFTVSHFLNSHLFLQFLHLASESTPDSITSLIDLFGYKEKALQLRGFFIGMHFFKVFLADPHQLRDI